MNNIAILVRERLGDALLHTPAVHWLRSQYPDAKIDVIAPSILAYQVFANNPDSSKTIFFDEMTAAELNSYDSIVSLPENKYLISIKELSNNNILLSNTDEEGPHRVKVVTASILDAIGQKFDESVPLNYRFRPSNKSVARVNLLLNNEESPTIRIGCHVGCHGMAKQSRLGIGKKRHKKVWPLSDYKKLIANLHQRIPGSQIILTGSNDELRYSKRLRGDGVVDLVGQTNIDDLASVIAACDFYISPDTGSLHLACTTETRTVGLFGPTDPAVWGPWPGHIQSFIFSAPNVTDISPLEVVEKIENWLEDS